jgi:CHASE3 domain sensor protein
MKTGKPTRLSEKLNAELDTIRQDYAASMASQLESFRTDLNSIATNAQHTIEIDTRTFLRQNKSWLTISPWLITGTLLVGIVSMMAASLLWTLLLASSELTDLGLTRIDR